jgi:hypothetical protein
MAVLKPVFGRGPRDGGERPLEDDCWGEIVNGALRPEPEPVITDRREQTPAKARIGYAVLGNGARHEIVDRKHRVHAGGRMPRATDIAPAPSPQQLIEPVAQLVLVIGFCEARQVELGALGQFGIAGRQQDRQ